MKDSKTKTEESTRLPCTGLCHSCCHAYLETSVSQEGGDGEVPCTETTSLCTYVREEGDDGEAP